MASAQITLPSRNEDWNWAQAAYESGRFSVSQIAKDVGSTIGKVSSMAQRGGWVRDPNAKARIQEEANAIIAKQVGEERASIERITAQMQSKVLVAHRKDIHAARLLCQMLVSELAAVSLNLEIFEDIGELLRSPDDRGRDRLNDAYHRVLKLPERSATLASLANTLKTLIMLERQAFSIEGQLDDPDAKRPQEEVTRGLDKIMDKFNQVLALQAPPPASTPVQVIIDAA